MIATDWAKVPIGIDAPKWLSRTGCRTVLVVAHTLVSCHRLLDVIDHIESDPRIQVVFTVAPDVFNHGVPQYLDELGAFTLPWEQAIRHRFDLALAAAHGSLVDVHAPLVVMAHGAGHGKLVRRQHSQGPASTESAVYGLDAQRLTHDGRVLASALVLAHEDEREILRRQCPEALPVAVVAGDPSFDRLVASTAWRTRYRRSFGVADRQLVVVSSTWGAGGLFGRVPDLLPMLMEQLPARRFRVAALLHPAVWAAHGTRQVRAWLRDCCSAGLVLPGPEYDWRGLVVAADCLIGDHGSVTAYGAAIGRPVLQLDAGGPSGTAPGTAQHLILTSATRLDPTRPLEPQVLSARALDPQTVAMALTSRPGQAGRHLRSTLYRLLLLDEPGRHRRATPVPVIDWRRP